MVHPYHRVSVSVAHRELRPTRPRTGNPQPRTHPQPFDLDRIFWSTDHPSVGDIHSIASISDLDPEHRAVVRRARRRFALMLGVLFVAGLLVGRFTLNAFNRVLATELRLQATQLRLAVAEKRARENLTCVSFERYMQAYHEGYAIHAKTRNALVPHPLFCFGGGVDLGRAWAEGKEDALAELRSQSR